MLTRLFNSAVLLVLPTVETILVGIAKMLAFVEAREAALERHIEDRVVAIAESTRKRRDVIQAVNDRFDRITDRQVTAIETAREEVRAAVNARSAVENLLNNRG
jgi:demethoxyubiquinone hydroxylase (CLK1/Coq7/Cat5 family)